jgi:hypothetical protein
VLDQRAEAGDAAHAHRTPAPTTQLILAEDNDAVIKIISKGRSSALRHVPRSHRISIHWLVEAFRRDGVKIRFVSTKAQIADLLTKHFHQARGLAATPEARWNQAPRAIV